jgi:hypothetical protein
MKSRSASAGAKRASTGRTRMPSRGRDAHHVLLRRRQLRAGGHGPRAQRRDLGVAIGVVVGEALAREELGAAGLERREELARPPDAREGEEATPAQARRILRRGLERRAQDRCARGEARGEAEPVLPDQREAVGEREPVRKRRAQRPGRHRPPVAEARLAIDHDEAQRLGERGVLQPVVHDDAVRALGGGEARARDAIARDDGGRDAREQERLVAGVGGGVARGIDAQRPGERAAMAAAEEEGAAARREQDAGGGDGDRRLARAARGQVADAQDRHRRRGRAREALAQHRRLAEQPGGRREKPRLPALAQPELRCAHPPRLRQAAPARVPARP